MAITGEGVWELHRLAPCSTFVATKDDVRIALPPILAEQECDLALIGREDRAGLAQMHVGGTLQ